MKNPPPALQHSHEPIVLLRRPTADLRPPMMGDPYFYLTYRKMHYIFRINVKFNMNEKYIELYSL